MTAKQPDPPELSRRLAAPAWGELAKTYLDLPHGDSGPAVTVGFCLFNGLPHEIQQEAMQYVKLLKHFDIERYVSMDDVRLIIRGKLDSTHALDKARKRAK